MFASLFLGLTNETEEPDLDRRSRNACISGSEGNKENAFAQKVLCNRRQKKNRGEKEDGFPVSKKMTRKTKRADGYGLKRWDATFKLSDVELSGLLRNYVLTPNQRMNLGYPIESSLHPGQAIIYKTGSPQEQCQIPSSSHLIDVNAKEFVPSVFLQKKTMKYLGFPARERASDSSGESENGSKSSTRTDEDSDFGDDKDIDKEVLRSENIIQRKSLEKDVLSEEKKCVRCGSSFFMMINGKYLTHEKCRYHWGKLKRTFKTNAIGAVTAKSEFSCCGGKRNSDGCTTAKLHVWNDIAIGVNGPLDGYVKTSMKKSPSLDGNYGVYSMDCEMCYTTQGLELTKITVVAADGRTVYDSFVKPKNAIIDYNTRFSGITAKDLNKGNSAKSLKEVQNDLMCFINADTILIGHGLENDLKALKMIHSTIVDTAVVFPHHYGLPYRRSLRSLVHSFLKRDIQSCSHDSAEDAKACMELMLWRLKKDLKNRFDSESKQFAEKC